MNEIIINGKFLSQKITGVQRYSIEILKTLSENKDLKIIVALPKNVAIPNNFLSNCQFEHVGKFNGTLWEQISLPRFCIKKKLPLLCLGNIVPVLYKKYSYLVLHDVTFKEKMPYNEKLWALKYRLFTRLYIRSCKRIFTVSEFSRERIKYFYPDIDPIVTYNGWEHIQTKIPNNIENIKCEFYLSVGSVNSNKNFQYILHLAKNNPNLNFVIAGRLNNSYMEFLNKNNILNCFFTGYLSDEQLLWLYKHCKGFILPSLYEGFGLPPLEAIAVGCRNIYLSDIPVFREVYGSVAKFFDPLDYEHTVDLSDVNPDERDIDKLKEICSWKRSANIIYNNIFGDENNADR